MTWLSVSGSVLSQAWLNDSVKLSPEKNFFSNFYTDKTMRRRKYCILCFERNRKFKNKYSKSEVTGISFNFHYFAINLILSGFFFGFYFLRPYQTLTTKEQKNDWIWSVWKCMDAVYCVKCVLRCKTKEQKAWSKTRASRQDLVNRAATWHIGRVLVLTRNTGNMFPVRPLLE